MVVSIFRFFIRGYGILGNYYNHIMVGVNLLPFVLVVMKV